MWIVFVGSLPKGTSFELKSYYHVLTIPIGSLFPWNSIWRVKGHLRVAFFVWSTALGKILTLDNLKKRNVIVVDWCYMCKKSRGSIDHLLLHCEAARDLWSSPFKLVGAVMVMLRRVRDLLVSWRGQDGGHKMLEV
jgi:hypothetical protein